MHHHPERFCNKWAEHSMSIRRKEEPTLFDLEIWLQARVMARSDPYLPENDSKSQKSPGSRSQKNQDPPTSTMHTRGSQSRGKWRVPPPRMPLSLCPSLCPFTFVYHFAPIGWQGLTLTPIVLQGGLAGIRGDYDVIMIAQYLKIAHFSSFLQIWYIFRAIFEVSHFQVKGG